MIWHYQTSYCNQNFYIFTRWQIPSGKKIEILTINVPSPRILSSVYVYSKTIQTNTNLLIVSTKKEEKTKRESTIKRIYFNHKSNWPQFWIVKNTRKISQCRTRSFAWSLSLSCIMQILAKSILKISNNKHRPTDWYDSYKSLWETKSNITVQSSIQKIYRIWINRQTPKI